MSSSVEIAVVGGTGVNLRRRLDGGKRRQLTTPYGEAGVTVGGLAGREVAFMARHGPGHSVPPHRVNYRANMWALRNLGVRRVVGTAAVGALDAALVPGTVVLVDQFLDFTSGRPSTFYDGGEQGVVHVDVTDPYCPQVRAVALDAAAGAGLDARDGGVYVCTQGPRFETAAEVRAYRMLGGDVVGMTGLPEVVLARELGLCYATVAVVTNLAAGLGEEPPSHEEVLEVQARSTDRLVDLLMRLVADLPAERGCRCAAVPDRIGAGGAS